MTQEIEVDFELHDIQLDIEGTYSDRMAEKLMREVNTILYSKDFYCFGFDLETGLTELASASKGVLYND